ncbi:MAG: PHB depolymerase family esterase [Hoeflea sp.]|uniref:extracellular catalytic domain type 1 short-chain-length polyhydroxyalkanoate depolymerase n=1 Tax=Hoeflea sp. TaxID=1940281 RepID=UPI001D29F93B|nr:PHB depolymerase family esterase [Hoeflea sp.]MBU4527800.1 PHB depolymerase family esterase [Alphaproteobacteria bacterium]MBU4546165.1 PHB depolymerase family esterase [Alphaproteobacteria bacterium]MBU4553150.1 PHB depolymerase family esterase [Alphaproteobacteria bacterium]MBV1724222.1 PHB depolymerase family esterase [Hoeflea sp.]MBV1759907.1 PHB depolymerase family esterase [Hoeflea sp.]
MNTNLSRGMSRATELTRAGRLDEATALIRSLLQPSSEPGHDSEGSGVIEGTFTRLGNTAPEAPAATAPRTAATGNRTHRTGLRETIRRIAAGGMPSRGEVTARPLHLPHGARFLSLAHHGAGRRDYRLYIPANSTGERGQPMPLIVMLHGCTQSPEDFAIGTGMNALAEEYGCLIAWPAQPQGANAQKCWNWFRPEDQGNGRGEPALIAGIVADILRDHPADPERVYVAGLSAGGAAAAILGAAYPELFAAVGVHSGLPAGGARDVPSAFAAMRGGSTGKASAVTVPAIVFHGLADKTVHPGNGEAVVAQAMQTRSGLNRVCVSGGSEGGRAYRQTRHEDALGRSITEHWEIDGAGHAWSGGQPGGSYTDPKGPDASREMLRFFLQHRRA